MFLQQRIIVSLSSQSFLFLAGLEVKVVPLKKFIPTLVVDYSIIT